MIELLIANNIMLAVGVVSIVFLFALLVRSEYKLAKYGESWFFRRKKK